MAISTVNFGNADLLRQNLVEMVAGHEDWSVVVVDNFTTDANRAEVVSLTDEQGWHLVGEPGNLGFGAGVNAAARRAWELGADVMVVINPDAWIDGDNVALLAAALEHDPMSVVAPIVRRPDGSPWFQGLQMSWEDGAIRNPRRDPAAPGEHRLDWLSGACFATTPAMWEASGGFDDDYFLYWEDVDFSKRVQDAGGTVRVVREAQAWHDEGGTQDDARRRVEAKSGTYYYYNIVNRMLFAAKHLDREGFLRWRRSILPHAKSILWRGGRRQFLQSGEPWISGLRGVRDAYRVSHQGGVSRRRAQGEPLD
ncbi:glycosyltransferase family 2 protein [Aeromicrobium sp. zg-636]|uniref:Glycosyltransferase family 2 protein n=1 Tax=Aeromicrobium senzhongii TaxID=2663859 RepID=A0A8I0K1M2_9ACTN|nr:glycosyltransferase family 2 protein [Aeromicrobium sp. 636]MBC9227706.1 glycosyltransferase family 2 protein [Aeromicrobium senzhongii]